MSISRRTRARRRISVLGAVALVAVVAGCSGGPSPAPSTDPAQEQPQSGIAGPDEHALFTGAGNPYSTPLPRETPVDPDSAAYVAKLLEQKPLVSVNGWTIPVYEADAATPKYEVTATEDHTGHGGWVLPGVPIPADAKPDPQEDGHLVVVDRPANCVYEFWQARRNGDGWQASWVNATPADGTGVYPDGLSARASGLSAAAGLIWPQELATGEIKHALVFASPSSRSGGPAAPATASDGRDDDAGALPMGSRLRLDPSVDVDALDLPAPLRTIAKAVQDYGIVLTDTSGGFTLYAVSPQSFPQYPYPQSWSHDLWKDVGAIPFDKLQVVSAGPQQQRYSGPPITNSCNAAVQQPPRDDSGDDDGGDG